MAEVRQVQAVPPPPQTPGFALPQRPPQERPRQREQGVTVEISPRARQALAVSQAPRIVQAARTTGQVQAPPPPPPPVRVGRFEAAPPRPRLPVAIIRNPSPPPAAARPLPPVRLESPAIPVERIVQARVRAAALPAALARGEDRVFAEHAVRNQDAQTEALLRSLEQRALAVTIGPSGGLRAPGAVAASILDTAR